MNSVSIDIGNTRMKLGAFHGEELMAAHNVQADDWDALEAFAKKWEAEHVILSSTAGKQKGLENFLMRRFNSLLLEWNRIKLPIGSVYRTPNTLGTDRIAAVCGAAALFPERDCLVVDAGTCVTYDLINGKGVYLGGNISPGVGMRLQAMHEFTATLPLVAKQHPDTHRGYSTETAIRAGAVWGAAREISGFINQFNDDTGTLTTLLTGGDAVLLSSLIPQTTHTIPHLVLIGLNKILRYNVE